MYHCDVLATFHVDFDGYFIRDVPVTSLGQTRQKDVTNTSSQRSLAEWVFCLYILWSCVFLNNPFNNKYETYQYHLKKCYKKNVWNCIHIYQFHKLNLLFLPFFPFFKFLYYLQFLYLIDLQESHLQLLIFDQLVLKILRLQVFLLAFHCFYLFFQTYLFLLLYFD